MRASQYLAKLIQTNSGASSKAFFLVSVTIHTDLMGLAAVIGAIGSLFATAGITKAFGERNETNNNSNKQEET